MPSAHSDFRAASSSASISASPVPSTSLGSSFVPIALFRLPSSPPSVTSAPPSLPSAPVLSAASQLLFFFWLLLLNFLFLFIQPLSYKYIYIFLNFSQFFNRTVQLMFTLINSPPVYLHLLSKLLARLFMQIASV